MEGGAFAVFREAAANGRLLLPRCTSCGRTHWYPRAFCPLCGAQELIWQSAAGYGTVYSVSVMRRVAKPYALALVTLDEGPTLLTNLVGCDLDAVLIGDRVRAIVSASEEGMPTIFFSPEHRVHPCGTTTRL